MASSSTRSTWKEKRLHSLLELAYWHLTAANAHDEGQFLIQRFADTLDMPVSHVLCVANPPSYGSENGATATSDTKQECTAGIEMIKPKNRQIMRIAGNTLLEVGATLSKVGRDKEATEWCQLGYQLEMFGTWPWIEEETHSIEDMI